VEPVQYPSNIALSDEEFAKFVSNIGVLFQTHGENSQALAYHQMALDSYVTIGDKNGIATAFSNIGAVLEGDGDFKGALGHYETALVIRQSIPGENSAPAVASSFNSISHVHLQQGDPETAIEYADLARDQLSTDDIECAKSLSITGVQALLFNYKHNKHKDSNHPEKSLQPLIARRRKPS
jgi:tetratricopeptide (TPR) repeat protein